MAEMSEFVEATNDALTSIGSFAQFIESISGGLGGLIALLIGLGIVIALVILFYKAILGRGK